MGANNNGIGVGRAIVLVIGCGITVFSIAGCIYLQHFLLTPWWIPALILLPAALALALPTRGFWHWLTGIRNVAVNLVCHMVFSFPLLLCATLTVNYVTAGKNADREEATVTRVYKETRYKTRRVNRRTYTRGAPYSVYFIEIHFNDGRTKDIEVLKKTYDRVSKGDTIGVDVSKGRLGMTVFDGRNLHLRERAKLKKTETYKEKRRRLHEEHADKVLRRKNRNDNTDPQWQ
ncbi:MAG: hypothetical protein K2I45_05435 [Muribaculaceae bacterium]|nr:hypothetical protein [Muribaculaceae bacterium]